MASLGKTSLGLSQWGGTDPIRREGFNEDNKILDATIAISNRIYDGTDLQEKFGSEIYNSYPSPWEWVADRIDMRFYAGLNVGDRISWESTNGYTVKSEIAGIDTYLNYGNTAVGPHIDFISKDCYPEAHAFNKVAYNNGTPISSYPLLASDIYAWLNSASGQVPNTATENPTLVAVDYTSSGVYDKLPTSLKSVITQKQVLLPQRYTAGSLQVNDNGYGWENIGPLWLPSEIEVFGQVAWGSLNGYSACAYQQYPIFSTNMKRIKGAADGGARASWWLLSAAGGAHSTMVFVRYSGNSEPVAASNVSMRVPVCFRIA